MPEVGRKSYDCLYNILKKLGLTISKKELVPPGTGVTCLGILIDTENATISIPHEKLQEICSTVQEWSVKNHVQKDNFNLSLASCCISTSAFVRLVCS